MMSRKQPRWTNHEDASSTLVIVVAGRGLLFEPGVKEGGQIVLIGGAGRIGGYYVVQAGRGGGGGVTATAAKDVVVLGGEGGADVVID